MSHDPRNVCLFCIRSNSLPSAQKSYSCRQQQFMSGRGGTDVSRDSAVAIVSRLRAEQLKNFSSIPNGGK
jgi:hypothetical protein